MHSAAKKPRTKPFRGNAAKYCLQRRSSLITICHTADASYTGTPGILFWLLIILLFLSTFFIPPAPRSALACAPEKRNGSEEPFLEEATTGFEPVIRVLQTHALPLGYVALTAPPRSRGTGAASSLSWTRTNDTAVNSRVLYRLSYQGVQNAKFRAKRL